MARLLDVLMRVDNLARIGARVLGTRSDSGRAFQQAAADLRSVLAPLALHQAAEQPDPKIDLMRVLAAAEDSGLSWPDIRDALNRYHETRTRG
ncbi:hypothetical protein [Paramagnetospirillum magneticum]|uniref:Uncharacterized protein n=1 Tax=Paramagnetospirillum magneticum (strain ATCC 700264 / AMB-1) TaxID=342108 RepID=Q2W6H3_PARM1|nr:hypothetical protein [Paramagnetospirillum magneticum]BAE50552.1 hypothetical protein amb1748 [Paramagnetospirillum magneticum AMB-1]